MSRFRATAYQAGAVYRDWHCFVPFVDRTYIRAIRMKALRPRLLVPSWHNGQSLAILVHQAVALAEGRSASAALAGAKAAARELPPSGNTGGTSSEALSHV